MAPERYVSGRRLTASLLMFPGCSAQSSHPTYVAQQPAGAFSDPLSRLGFSGKIVCLNRR